MDGVADGRYDSDREALRRRFHLSCLAAWVTHVVQWIPRSHCRIGRLFW
jgi:hypothetical protein